MGAGPPFGSLMMLASGVFASSPSSERVSGTFWAALSLSGNRARIRAATEMSALSTVMPALFAKRETSGSSA